MKGHWIQNYLITMSSMQQSSSAAESQVTLVDGRVGGESGTVVTFSRDDMKNTEILSSDGRVLYSVATNAQTRWRTLITRAVSGAGQDTREVVAEVQRRDLRPDLIAFAGEEEVKLSSWLNGRSGKWSDL